MHNLFRRFSKSEYVLALVVLLAIGAYFLNDRLNAPPDHADTNVAAAYRDGVITKEQILEHYRMAPPQDQKALRSLEGLRHVVADLAVHAVVERWATERQVDTKESFRRALKYAADAVTLYDVTQRMHEFDVKVEESEIQAYFDDHRDQFGGRSLSEVKEQIRTVVHAQKEREVTDQFLKDLRANASIIANLDLLDVPAPGESDLQAYYQNNREAFREPERVRVDDIRVKSKDKADRALARIQSGEDFAQVALEINEAASPSSEDFTARGARGAAFDANVFILSEGEVSKVFEQDGAYLIVRVREKRAGRLRPFDEVREGIAQQLRAEREQSYYAEKKNEILFSVNGIRYTLGDFLAEYNALPANLRTLYSSRDEKRKLVDGIMDRLLVLQSVPAKLAQSQNQKEIEEARRHVLAEMLHQDEMEGQLEVSDAEIEAHYNQNPRHYATPARAKISYIRVARGNDEASRTAAIQKIEAAYTRLRPPAPWDQGEEFAVVAREVSEDAETAKNGGAIEEWLTYSSAAVVDVNSHLFLQTVFSLKAGDISPAFGVGDSLYIVRVRERTEAQPQLLDKVRDLVRADVRDAKHQKVLSKFEQELLQRMGLSVHEERLKELLQELESP